MPILTLPRLNCQRLKKHQSSRIQFFQIGKKIQAKCSRSLRSNTFNRDCRFQVAFGLKPAALWSEK